MIWEITAFGVSSGLVGALFVWILTDPWWSQH